MNRRDVLKKIRRQAKAAGATYSEVELTNHTGVIVDGVRSTLARHAEIDDVTARKFWDQYAEVFGKGWWR